MALSKNKQMILDRFVTVLNNLDEKSEGDKKILSGMYEFLGGCIRSAELSATASVEEVSAEEPSFGEEEASGEEPAFGEEEAGGEEPSFGEEDAGGEEPSFGDEEASAEEPSFGDDEAVAEEESSFGEEEPAPKASRSAKAEPEDPFAKMSVQDVIDSLKNAGVDMEKVKAAHKAGKKDGLIKLVKDVDALSAKWATFLTKATVAQAEGLAKKKGVTVSYGRGRSNDDKKKATICDALAAKFIPVGK